MKYLKMLGFATVAMVALIAFVGPSMASATTLTGTGGTILKTGTTVHMVTEETTVMTTSFLNIECKESTIAGKTANESGMAVTVGVESWTFGSCNCEEKTLSGGTLSISWISGTSNGSLASNGAEITMQCNTIFGAVHCIYKTNNTTLGTLTGSTTTGGTATIDISSANIPRLATSALCAEKASWDVRYKIDNPDVLNVAS